MFYKNNPQKTTVKTRTEINQIKHSVAQLMVAPILPSTQIVFLANGVTPMEVIGETYLELSQNGRSLSIQALIVKDLDVEFLGGIPFMSNNDITIRPAKH